MNTCRVLNERDRGALLDLCARTPDDDNLFVAFRVTSYGLDPGRLGCPIYGYFRDGQLVAACHVGANLVPIGDDPEALDAFCELIGPRRTVVSIMGSQVPVMGLFDRLCARWGTSWSNVRELRATQPRMVIDHPPAIEPDPRIRVISMRDFQPYLSAAISMYTEEVGVSPLDPTGSYKNYVRTLIRTKCAFGGIHRGRVWFKSDVGVWWKGSAQVQGVWLDPSLRGHGLSAPAFSQVLTLCLERFDQVSLYVNDYNERARALYERVGMRQVGTMATVLY